MAKIMESTTTYWGYIGTMARKTEPTIVNWLRSVKREDLFLRGMVLSRPRCINNQCGSVSHLGAR